MTRDQVLAAIRKYDGWLGEAGVPVRKVGMTTRGPSAPAAMAHLRWMFSEMENWIEESQGKADRWIGFVQGALWLAGFGTIDEFKNDNR